MDIKDLPPWAQAQAANQIMARQRRGSGRGRAPSPALPDDEEEMPRRAASKYHNRKAARITAAGNILEFDSQKEARRYDELALLLAAGKSMPCDAEPALYKAREGAAGKIITGNGTVLSADIGGLAAFEPDGVGHVSHFATCPAAEQFRRKGAGRRGEDGQENGVPDLQEESSVCRRP